MKLSVGKRFVNKDAMKLAVSELCVIDNFSTKTLASSTKRLRMACSEESCGWFVYATSVSDSSSEFLIKSLNDVHSCSGLNSLDNPAASQAFIKNLISDSISDNRNRSIRDIRDELRRYDSNLDFTKEIKQSKYRISECIELKKLQKKRYLAVWRTVLSCCDLTLQLWKIKTVSIALHWIEHMMASSAGCSSLLELVFKLLLPVDC